MKSLMGSSFIYEVLLFVMKRIPVDILGCRCHIHRSIRFCALYLCHTHATWGSDALNVYVTDERSAGVMTPNITSDGVI